MFEIESTTNWPDVARSSELTSSVTVGSAPPGNTVRVYNKTAKGVLRLVIVRRLLSLYSNEDETGQLTLEIGESHIGIGKRGRQVKANTSAPQWRNCELTHFWIKSICLE